MEKWSDEGWSISDYRYTGLKNGTDWKTWLTACITSTSDLLKSNHQKAIQSTKLALEGT